MTRSAKKGPYVDEKLLKKVLKQKNEKKQGVIRTWARNSQVDPRYVGHTLGIHNGRHFIEVYITENMIGHYLGEFSPTRTFRGHGKVTKRTADKT